MQCKRRFKSALGWVAVLGFFLGWSTDAFAGRYLITVVEARIAPKKSRFARWDTGFGKMTLPDPFVVMEIAGERLTTKVVQNDLNPRWNASRLFVLKGNERVYLSVYDKDLRSNDLIGKIELSFEQLEKGLSLTFGKVEMLQIKVTRLEQPDVRATEPVERPVVPVERPIERPVVPVERPIERPVVPVERPIERPVVPVERPVERPVVPVERPVERPVAPVERPVEPSKPAGRPVEIPPVPRVTAPEKTSAYEGLAAAGDISTKQFCYAVQRHTLFCMQKQYHAYATSADKKNQATAQFLSALIKRVESSLRSQDPQIEAQCQKAMLTDNFVGSRSCLDCLVQLGCPTLPQFRASCAQACAPPKTAPVEPAPVRRDEPAPVRRDEPAPVRRDEPAPVRRDEPAPVRRDEPAPVAAGSGVLGIQAFCNKATDYQRQCLLAQYEAAKKDPKQASVLGFFQVMIDRVEKNKAEIIGQCVKKYEEEQAKRKAANTPPLSEEVLGKCMACMESAACDRQKLQNCRAVCDGK
ncbi:hypothetical protein L6R29_19405 [Myxococcota bacterium]|nr:hypothetical protein [Myxococcota bacterium]